MKKILLMSKSVLPLVMISWTACADSVRLATLNKEVFNPDCNYDVYFHNRDTAPILKASAQYVSAGYIVFEYFNTLRTKHEAIRNDNGELVPKQSNYLPRKTYLIHYRAKSLAYPYSVAHTLHDEETSLAVWDGTSHSSDESPYYLKDASVYLAPGSRDTMNDIRISHIVQHCIPYTMQDSSRQEH